MDSRELWSEQSCKTCRVVTWPFLVCVRDVRQTCKGTGQMADC